MEYANLDNLSPDIRLRLTAGELERYEALVKKYPDYYLEVCPLSEARIRELTRYWEESRYDPELLYFSAITGPTWSDQQRILSGMCRHDRAIAGAAAEKHGEWHPAIPADAIKTRIERTTGARSAENLERLLEQEERQHEREMKEMQAKLDIALNNAAAAERAKEFFKGEYEQAKKTISGFTENLENGYGDLRQILASWQEHEQRAAAAQPAEEVLSEKEQERRERDKELKLNEASGHEAIFQILAQNMEPYIKEESVRIDYCRKVFTAKSLDEAVTTHTRDMVVLGHLPAGYLTDNKFASAFHKILNHRLTDSITTIIRKLGELAENVNG